MILCSTLAISMDLQGRGAVAHVGLSVFHVQNHEWMSVDMCVRVFFAWSGLRRE